MHERGLIRKDIKRANTLVDLASGGVSLTEFGIALVLPHEHQAPAPPEVIARTLAYMAPEQTGRMNRSVDSCSDLYPMPNGPIRCNRICNVCHHRLSVNRARVGSVARSMQRNE
jgi:serine/threonine protein kinase